MWRRRSSKRPRRSARPRKPDGLALQARSLLRLRILRAVLQMRDHICDVRELLLEVALVVLQALEELLAIREAAAEKDPRAAAPTMAMVSVHVHLPCS